MCELLDRFAARLFHDLFMFVENHLRNESGIRIDLPRSNLDFVSQPSGPHFNQGYIADYQIRGNW
jgi:hypothetical protein